MVRKRKAVPAGPAGILFVLVGMFYVLYDAWTNNPELAPHATATIILAIVLHKFIRVDFKLFPARVLFSIMASLGILSFFF